jgi:hypothetical protein
MTFSRPTLACAEVLTKAAQLMLAAMEVEETEQSLEDMVEALKTPGEAFEGLKSLDYNCWVIRDKDIQVFMAREQYLKQALLLTVRSWVIRHGILPQCKVGQEVEVSGYHERPLAIVSEVMAEDGLYLLHFVAPDSGTDRMVLVPFEAVHDLAQPPEAFQLMVG